MNDHDISKVICECKPEFRIRLFWSDSDPVVLVGSGCFGRIRIRLYWLVPDPLSKLSSSPNSVFQKIGRIRFKKSGLIRKKLYKIILNFFIERIVLQETDLFFLRIESGFCPKGGIRSRFFPKVAGSGSTPTGIAALM